MIRILVLVAVLTAAAASAAIASGTPAEQAACRPDVRRLCHAIKEGSGDLSFLACLQEHRAKLRRACREVLESHGQ
jgi:hypothetical protein